MGGPATVPMLPDSEVPRAKITVSSVQPVLAVMSFAVEPLVYLLAPPVLGGFVGVVVVVGTVLVAVGVDVARVVVGVEEAQG